LHKLLIISIASPLLAGVYKDDTLFKTYTIEGVASKNLPLMLQTILSEFDIKQFIYVNSPGSFMALKITYVTLKTISLIQNIPLFAVDGFAFNENRPIKAIGKLYFIKEDGTITTKKYNDTIKQEYSLPQKISHLSLSVDAQPKYEIPAV